MSKNYEMVIGLEVHVELKTASKIFCGCPTTFGAEPNTQCCPVCMGMPGTLPVLNGQVVDYAIKAGLATHCAIATYSKQDRKNYFYPDLPKAYQISQYDLPLCAHGHLDIETESGQKRIGITRIHIEEDAGKLVHDENGTFIDCNRCGVPLIEIVSEPDIRSAEEAKAYLQKLRAIILYTGISDCKMNEGSLRCDVNLSVRQVGDTKLGTRTEMKNLNSFQFIVKAIEYEFKRQVEAVEAGEKIIQETRRYDPNSGKTYSMRTKEEANDYRYFPDPDLAPIEMSQSVIEKIKASIPQLPDARKAVYVAKYGLTPFDSEALITEKAIADYFEQAAEKTAHPKILANLMVSEIFGMLPQESSDIPFKPKKLAGLATLVGEGNINSNTAKKVLKAMWESDADPKEFVEQNDLAQISDVKVLGEYIDEVIANNAKSVEDFKAGKQNALNALVGQVMKKTQGRANPVMVQEMIVRKVGK